MSDLRTILTGLYEQTGELTPQVVVDYARPRNSELHNRFEWDNKVAGEQYRCVQAAELIRGVKITFVSPETGKTERIRAFSSLYEVSDSTQCGYKPTEELLADETTSAILIRNCERELADVKRKYGHLKEFREVVAAVLV